MSTFSVVLCTAVPHAGAEAGGAFIKVDARECLLRSVELFLNRDAIKQIQLVVHPEGIEEARRKYGGHLGFSGVKLVTGGPKWIDQIAAAATKLEAECSHVIVHDAARPAVAYNDLDMLMAEAGKHPVAVLGAPVRTPLAEADDAGRVKSIRPPTDMWQIFSPWVYRKDVFLEMAKTKREPDPVEVTILRSWPLNLRVGTPQDATVMRAMIGLLPKPKIKASDNPFQEAQW